MGTKPTKKTNYNRCLRCVGKRRCSLKSAAPRLKLLFTNILLTSNKMSRFGKNKVMFVVIKRSTIIVYFRMMNKWLFAFFAVNLMWLFGYKVWFINIVTDFKFMPILGDIYYSISLSIIAGYIIYSITTEYPNIKQLIKYSFAYFKFIAEINYILFKLCVHFDIEKSDYKKTLIKVSDIDKKVSDLTNKGVTSLDSLMEKLKELTSEIRQISLRTDSKKYYPDHYYQTILNFETLDTILILNRPDVIDNILQKKDCVIGDFIKLFNFLNMTVKDGVKCLDKFGCSKRVLQSFEL